MAVETLHGSPEFPAAQGMPPTAHAAIDADLAALQARKDAWVGVAPRARVRLLDALIRDYAAVIPRWIAASCRAKGIGPNDPAVSEEWVAGVWPVMRHLRQFHQALGDIAAVGHPRIPGPVSTRADGQVVAQVFPFNGYDRLFFMGITGEVWMEPGVTRDGLAATQAVVYRDKGHAGRVALVLGAGNVASIGPMDVLYKLFVEDQVVVLKMNPVNEYLGPLIEEGFRALVEPGYLRVVYGGAAAGAYLCQHPLVEEIHITGSDKTFDAIVFGTGPEGAARKASGQPLLTKPISGELGNVSPVIVVPGPWSARDLAYQAEHLATMLVNNAGFNCNATRVIVQHAGWRQREALLGAVGSVLARIPVRSAYYPGARQRCDQFVAVHPDARRYGAGTDSALPWTLVAGVDPMRTDDICFTTEAFCGLFAETALDAPSVAEYVDRAVAFCNDDVWGTLNVTLLVHPASLKDPAVAAAVERAVANLRYGTVSVNYWAAGGFTLGSTTWGAYPGHPISDIQSGTGVVHNTLMFSRAQKSVIRAPFRSFPTPPWFALHGRAGRNVFPRLVGIEARPSPLKVPGVLWPAVMG